MSLSPVTFECHLYISGRDRVKYNLPAESGPRKVIRLAAPNYDQLVDPAFRRLLATFESIPQPSGVQVR